MEDTPGRLDERRKEKPDKFFSWAWITWLLAFVVLEAWALLRKAPGDTLTENVKYVMAHFWWAWTAVGGLLSWLFYHFMIAP